MAFVCIRGQGLNLTLEHTQTASSFLQKQAEIFLACENKSLSNILTKPGKILAAW